MRRNYLIVIIILFISSVCVLGIRQARGNIVSKIDLSKIPLEIGDWKGEELVIEDDLYEALETKDIIIRRYTGSAGNPIFFTVVFSGDKRHSFHPPELCYLGGSQVKLLDKRQEQVALEEGKQITTNKLVMKTGDTQMRAWYWFAASDRFVSSYYLQQVYLMLDALKGKSLNGALIRVSGRGSPQLVESQVKTFIRQVYPYLDGVFKNL